MTSYTGSIPFSGTTMTPGNGAITDVVNGNPDAVALTVINSGTTLQIKPTYGKTGVASGSWTDDSGSNSFSFSWDGFGKGSDRYITPACNA